MENEILARLRLHGCGMRSWLGMKLGLSRGSTRRRYGWVKECGRYWVQAESIRLWNVREEVARVEPRRRR